MRRSERLDGDLNLEGVVREGKGGIRLEDFSRVF